MEKKVKKVLTSKDWNRVLWTMLKYKREEGYVDLVNDKLTFFDSDPCLNGIHACYVTIDDVIDYMRSGK